MKKQYSSDTFHVKIVRIMVQDAKRTFPRQIGSSLVKLQLLCWRKFLVISLTSCAWCTKCEKSTIRWEHAHLLIPIDIDLYSFRYILSSNARARMFSANGCEKWAKNCTYTFLYISSIDYYYILVCTIIFCFISVFILPWTKSNTKIR